MNAVPVGVGPADRLLVMAPHPDDETLAAGGLLRATLAAGAVVRVVILTNGDNNPWPQRVYERRWRLRPVDRRHWGERRRGESVCALRMLGVAEADMQFLDWPDLGVTGLLMADPHSCVATLAAIIQEFAPTRIIVPALVDTHPDHSAIGVIVALAVRQLRAMAQVLDYTIHRRTACANNAATTSGNACILHLDAAAFAAKQAALLRYTSQLQFGKHRILRHLHADELFHVVRPSASTIHAQLPAVADGSRCDNLRWCLRVVWSDPDGALRARSIPMHADTLRVVKQTELSTPSVSPPADAGSCQLFAKIERRQHGPFIFDAAGWLSGMPALHVLSARNDVPTSTTQLRPV